MFQVVRLRNAEPPRARVWLLAVPAACVSVLALGPLALLDRRPPVEPARPSCAASPIASASDVGALSAPGAAHASLGSAMRVETPLGPFEERYAQVPLEELRQALDDAADALDDELELCVDLAFEQGRFETHKIGSGRKPGIEARRNELRSKNREIVIERRIGDSVQLALLSREHHPRLYELVDEVHWLRGRAPDDNRRRP